jgi:hypothetical protein
MLVSNLWDEGFKAQKTDQRSYLALPPRKGDRKSLRGLRVLSYRWVTASWSLPCNDTVGYRRHLLKERIDVVTR